MILSIIHYPLKIIHYFTAVIFFNFSIKNNTSSSVLKCEKENRMHFRDGSTSKASKTCEPPSAPELHAEPPEADMPDMSRLNNINSDFAEGGNETFSTL